MDDSLATAALKHLMNLVCDLISLSATKHIRIFTCSDDSIRQNSKFCIVSENLVSQNPDVLEKN